MRKARSAFSLGLCALSVVAICAPSYAVMITTAAYNPQTNGTGTTSYGAGPWDYQSLPDSSGLKAGVQTTVLSSVGTPQGSAVPAAPNTQVGLAEAFTPRVTNVGYGAPNDHGFKLNKITVPVVGGNVNLTGANGVTLKVYQPTFTGSGLNSGDSGFAFDAGGGGTVLYSTTFDFTPGNARLMTIDLQGAGPTLAAGTSYALAFEWNTNASASPPIDTNSFVWYRLPDASTADATNAGPTIDPSGQGYRLVAAGTGYGTIAATGGAGGAPRTYGMALSSVPEPGTLLLLGLIAPALAAGRYRK